MRKKWESRPIRLPFFFIRRKWKERGSLVYHDDDDSGKLMGNVMKFLSTWPNILFFFSLLFFFFFFSASVWIRMSTFSFFGGFLLPTCIHTRLYGDDHHCSRYDTTSGATKKIQPGWIFWFLGIGNKCLSVCVITTTKKQKSGGEICPCPREGRKVIDSAITLLSACAHSAICATGACSPLLIHGSDFLGEGL